MSNHSDIEMASQCDDGSSATVLDLSTAKKVAEIFGAMSDPMRVRILTALISFELNVQQLASFIDLSESATSHQLRLLRTLHIVRTRKVGRQVFYTLDDDHIKELIQRVVEHIQHK